MNLFNTPMNKCGTITHLERLRGIRCTRSLEHIHVVLRVIAALCHRDVDVKLSIDEMKFRRPNI